MIPLIALDDGCAVGRAAPSTSVRDRVERSNEGAGTKPRWLPGRIQAIVSAPRGKALGRQHSPFSAATGNVDRFWRVIPGGLWRVASRSGTAQTVRGGRNVKDRTPQWLGAASPNAERCLH